MFIIFLRFAENRSRVGDLLAEHKQWLAQGMKDGVFLLAGTLSDKGGGAILAVGETRPQIEARIARDPFVAQKVVTAEIHEMTPALAADSMQFLLPPADPA